MRIYIDLGNTLKIKTDYDNLIKSTPFLQVYSLRNMVKYRIEKKDIKYVALQYFITNNNREMSHEYLPTELAVSYKVDKESDKLILDYLHFKKT